MLMHISRTWNHTKSMKHRYTELGKIPMTFLWGFGIVVGIIIDTVIPTTIPVLV